jgi:hypothetical protein
MRITLVFPRPNDDANEYITEKFKQALRKIESQPDNTDLLQNKLRVIDAKLTKLADAIESVGVSDTLANRLAALGREKASVEQTLNTLPAPVKSLPDVIPALVRRWREMVIAIESLADNPPPLNYTRFSGSYVSRRSS